MGRGHLNGVSASTIRSTNDRARGQQSSTVILYGDHSREHELGTGSNSDTVTIRLGRVDQAKILKLLEWFDRMEYSTKPDAFSGDIQELVTGLAALPDKAVQDYTLSESQAKYLIETINWMDQQLSRDLSIELNVARKLEAALNSQ